jgi:hypothetical protein
VNSASEFNLADCPGYLEAVEREREIRAASCLGLNETICGLDVKPLTGDMWRLLKLTRSPFNGFNSVKLLCAKPDILADILRFFWIVSPIYEQGSRASEPRKWYQLPATPTARDRFNEAFSPIVKLGVDIVVKAILEYVDEAFIDSDDSPRDSIKSYYAEDIAIAHEFCDAYPTCYRVDFWNPTCPPEQNPLHVPLKIVFQLRKLRAQIAHGKEAGITNKSDRLVEAMARN